MGTAACYCYCTTGADDATTGLDSRVRAIGLESLEFVVVCLLYVAWIWKGKGMGSVAAVARCWNFWFF
uniref:Uncharacterized protein n=1 Tax=Solanum tuberosum TaxID=4113 RepID=M1CEG6_SOLTU